MFARPVGSRRLRTRSKAVIAAVAAAAITAGVVQGAEIVLAHRGVAAAAPGANLGKPVTDVSRVPVTHIRISTQSKTTVTASGSADAWPAAATSSLSLAAAGRRSSAPGTPVWAQAESSNGSAAGPGSLAVSVQPHSLAAKLGVAGVVWSLAPTSPRAAGTIKVGLNYGSFAQAVGGNYASRLRLVELPACALTTPQLAQCRVQTPLTSVNDPASASVSAQVKLAADGGSASGASYRAGSASVTDADYTPAGADAVIEDASTSGAATVIGATDSTGQEGGQGGDYAQDGLSSAGSWAQSGSSGDFTYTYTVDLPGSSSSLTPDADLSYDSGTVDGTTSTTQAQASWIGDGWASQDSYVEQTFTPCDDQPEGSAGSVTTTDECYDGQILTLSLDGTSTAIVYDSTSGTYKLQDDDGATLTKVTGSDNGTGTYDTSYWKITEQDGTAYYFGMNELPGWASGDATTNSVDSERVYAAHSGDPCYNATPASSYCTMAYKWHLDYVVNTKSEAMAYYYTQATNYYGAYSGASEVQYVRDSYLAHIDYGFTTAGGAYGTVPDKVVYTVGARCVAGSSSCGTAETTSNAASYPDVPYDLDCASGATCSAYAPSFFSTVRLTNLSTEQYSTTSSSYVTVDSYALSQTEPSTGDATSATLWLSQIQRTAEDTTAGSNTDVTLPPVQFGGTAMANRVDTTSLPSMFRYRLTSITNETGGVIGITYGLPSACTASYVEAQTAASAANNTESCYPVYWTPLGYTAPIMDWFEKYAVTRVLESDTTGGSEADETDYSYTGAAWHYDDNELTKTKYRTYGQWRGYQKVTTTTGAGANNPLTESVTSYYQGMDGDYLTPTSTRSVSLTDSQGGVHADADQLAGEVLETDSYLGDGGPLDHFSIDSYWVSAALATRTRTGLPALTANMTGPAETYKGQHLTDGNESSWRYTETDTSYDAVATDADFGQPEYVYSHTVPVNSAYNRCTSNTYTAPNTAVNLVGLIGQTETDAAACSGFAEDAEPSQPAALNTLSAPTGLTRPGDVVSAGQTFYDGATSISTAPTVGLATRKTTATGYSSGAFTWRTDSTTTYDTPARYSRPLTTTNADGETTTTGYTINSAGLTTGESTQNALKQTSSVTLDPERGLTLTSTDPNGVVTTDWYDAMGRMIDEWDASRATTANANTINTYTVSNSSVSGEVSEKLSESNAYALTVTITDSLGRTRQTQTTTPQGGRLITDEVYDSRGWAEKKNNAYWDSATTPTLSLATVPDNQVPDQDDYVYDGLGRVVQDKSENDASAVSTTTTVYNGDATTVIPPTGGVEKTTVTDPLGRISQVEEYSVDPTLTVPANTNTGVFYLTGGTPVTTTTSYGFDTTSADATFGDTYTTTVDAKGDTSTSYTDLAGDVVEKIDPTAGTTYLAYDADGNLTQSEDARGDYVSYTYDALDRKTGQYAAAANAQVAGASGNQTAAWVYDDSNSAITTMADPIGHVTTETAYSGGSAYVTQYNGFNAFGESTGESVTIPAAQGKLAGTYTTVHTYLPNTGLAYRDQIPAAGGLASEVLTHTYTSALDLPLTLNGTNGYLKSVTYDAWSRPVQEALGISTTGLAYVNDTYDPHSGALTNQLTTRGSTTPADIDQEAYTYDLSGNVTEKTSTRLGSSSTSETQCYTYNPLDELTTAWTATDNCATTPSSGSDSTVGNTLGNNSAYWDSWTYDDAGNRETQDQHSLTSGTADTVTDYSYSTSQPNTLASASSTGGTTGTTSYAYDAAGDTTTRDTSAGNQTLTWNNLGELAKDANSTTGSASSYVYGADGNLLLEIDPTATTLYLEGQQVTLTTATGVQSAVRTYQLPADVSAVRTGTGNAYDFQIGDLQGTGDLYLDYTAQVPTWRQFDPYGNPRGTAVTWIDNRGFLNDPTDTATSLTDIGARWYDPTTGRFESLDPVFEADDPLALGGYAYTDGNPVTYQDPTGECMRFDSDGPCVDNLLHGTTAQKQDIEKMQNAVDRHTAQEFSDYARYGVHAGGFDYDEGGSSKGTASVSSGGVGSWLSSTVSSSWHHIVQYGRDVAPAAQLFTPTAAALGGSGLGCTVPGCDFNPLSGIEHLGGRVLAHMNISVSGCLLFIACAGLTAQDGHLWVDYGGGANMSTSAPPGFPESLTMSARANVNIGWTSSLPQDQVGTSAQGCLADGVGGCVETGKNDSGNEWWGVSGGLGFGGGFDLYNSKELF